MYKATIGLEIHAELKTSSKMFCSCMNEPNEKEPNKNVCPICLGHPGTLPVINEEAVKKVIKAGLALNCRILEETKFDRKNYFYPDLPKGYQISQYDKPISENGFLVIKGKKIRIKRIHLEEDTGSIIHRKDSSLINFNRAGVPLMELVTEPDIENEKEAKAFAEELQLIFKYLEVSDAEMEKGQMRVEVNISLSKNQELGTKVEIKNLNSFKIVEKAVLYEIKRQSEVLAQGEKVVQETRGWDEGKGITVSQREKEEAHDYRYFPEPDLPPLFLSEEYISKISVSELPEERRERFKKEYFLTDNVVEIFVRKKELGDYFEKTVSELNNWIKEVEFKRTLDKEERKKLIKLCSNYIITDLQKMISGEIPITPENFAEFITLIYEGSLSSKMAKDVLDKMFKTGADPSHIIEEGGMEQLTDEDKIKEAIEAVVSENRKAVEDYKKGKEKALQFLAGQVMARTRGMANPEKVFKILKEII